jgi:molecular chaperone DnaK
MESLSNASHKLTEMMYQQAGTGQQQASAGGSQGYQGSEQQASSDGAGAEEEVIDAEVVDEDKKS